jgi:type IV pilus assembly protein PilB
MVERIPTSAWCEEGPRIELPVSLPKPMAGYKGRLGLYSVMEMTERLKDLTVTGAPQAEIEEVAREEGMLTLREAGLLKVRAGLTGIEEVARVAV